MKPAAFDLFLGGCIAGYLGLVYYAIQVCSTVRDGPETHIHYMWSFHEHKSLHYCIFAELWKCLCKTQSCHEKQTAVRRSRTSAEACVKKNNCFRNEGVLNGPTRHWHLCCVVLYFTCLCTFIKKKKKEWSFLANIIAFIPLFSAFTCHIVVNFPEHLHLCWLWRWF